MECLLVMFFVFGALIGLVFTVFLGLLLPISEIILGNYSTIPLFVLVPIGIFVVVFCLYMIYNILNNE